ncbi:hypothetical protein OID55_41490 (plasmid) [Streptomyces sp. NBC_00715]|uniref:hypothetical protein n=1 Tax=Streptomyces sp. NBC_00715 TaxID=2975811 RepID=UPI002F90FDA8
MNPELGSLITAAAKTADKADGPTPLQIAASLTVGFIIAIAAGFLHRSDRPDPSLTVTYSPQAAVMRAGIALFGSAFLALATLMAPRQDVSMLILLVSAAGGVIYGLLGYYDVSTLQAAIWKGARVTASAAALGQAFLAFYGS